MSQALAINLDSATEKPARWPVIWMATLVASSFGPYLVGSVRTDQIAAYGSAIILGVLWMSRIRPTRAQVASIGLLVVFAILAFIHFVFNPNLRGRASIAMLDNITLPIAACIVALALIRVAGRERLLNVVATTTVLAMLINTVLTISQVGTSGPLLLGRWRAPGEVSVGDLAAEVGRFTGILNQPAMASILYGLTILLAIYRLRRNPLLLTLVFTLLMVGGILSISKAFLFVVVPVCTLVLVTVFYRRNGMLLVWLGGLVCLVVLLQNQVFDFLENRTEWSGADRLRMVIVDLGNVGGVTGGRLGDSGTVTAAMDVVREAAPFVGLGPGALAETPVDTLWLLGASINGLIGYVTVTALLAVLTVGVLRRRKSLPHIEFLIGMGLVVILIGGAFGYPVFYGDRLAIPLWLTLMLLLSADPSDARLPSLRQKNSKVHADKV